MGYYEVTMSVPYESREAIMNELTELGSSGLIDKDKEILAYFEEKTDMKLISEQLTLFREVLKSSGLDPRFSFAYALLPEKDWNENWKKNFSPIDIGENLTIIPSWMKKDTERTPLIIDPGMVFGTGYHETSQDCLVLIEKIAKESRKQRCLDIGTGTGILAIGAAKLGFREVIALDIDPMAIDAAVRNVQENGLSNVIVIEGDIRSAEGPFDLIVANLLSGILVDIAPEIVSRLSAEGIAILSGMLIGQQDEVIETFRKEGLALRDTVISGNWVTLVLSAGNEGRDEA